MIQFETLVTSFESKHSLSELHAIVDLSPDDSPHHPVREPAQKDLLVMEKVLSVLKKETNISEETYKELKEKYKVLSRAVGMIHNGVVDHTR